MAKKVLLLGSGFVARPAAEYIIRSSLNKLTIACRTLASAQALASGLPRTSAVSLDVNNTEELEKAVAAHDLVVNNVHRSLARFLTLCNISKTIFCMNSSYHEYIFQFLSISYD